jgi:ligand-binding sensor domain-containing protein
VYSNINFVRGVATLDGRTYAATEGGVVAWDAATAKVAQRWTTANGLSHNLTTSVVVCPVPEIRVVVGTEKGLNLYDPKANAWQRLTPANSKMSGASVAALLCDAATGTLVIGYDSDGLDVYNARAGDWRHIGRTEGLASDYVNAMAMSADGKDIWVASPFGASLVSGEGVKVFDRKTTKLASDGVSGIAVDTAGNVWWGMFEGVVRFSKGAYKLVGETTVAKFPFGTITAIAAAADGSVWLGSGFGDLCHLDAAGQRCLAFAGMPGGPAGLNALAVDARGVVYVASDGAGFSAYDGKAWKQFLGPDERLASNRISALAQDSAGMVWVGTDNGISRGKPGPAGVAWELVRAAERGLPDNVISALCARPKGGMWVAAGAPALYDNGRWTVLTASQGLLQEAVTSIAVDLQDRAWFGTSAGLSMWDGKRMTNLARAQGLPDEQVQALLADGEVMWIGTPSGLVRYDGKAWRLFNDRSAGLPSADVTAIARGADGQLLVGTSRGLARFDGAQASVVREVASDIVTAISVGKNGAVWVATLRGAYRFDGNSWRHVTTADGLPTDRLMAVLVDAAGSVWLGGDGAGVSNLAP